MCNCKQCERIYDQHTCQPHYRSTIKYISMSKNTSSKGDQIRLKKSSRRHMIMNISLSLAKPIGRYCAIIGISRHRKNKNKTETEPKPGLVLPQVARVMSSHSITTFGFNYCSPSSSRVVSTSTSRVHRISFLQPITNTFSNTIT